MSKTERKAGWYWVTIGDIVEPAEYVNGLACWYVIGSVDPYSDADFAFIDATPITPNAVVEAKMDAAQEVMELFITHPASLAMAKYNELITRLEQLTQTLKK